jgi:hypothetical protein
MKPYDYNKNERYREYRKAYRDTHDEHYKEYQKAYRDAHKKEMKEYNKKYRLLHSDERKKKRKEDADKIRECYSKWYAKNGRSRSDNYIEKILEWGEKFPERVKIHKQVNNAIRMDEIVRPNYCPRCGRKKRPQAHHYNYIHFMNFIWLCASCHKREHNKNKKIP